MNKNHPLVKLAFDNIKPLQCWGDEAIRTPRYFTVKTITNRKVCVIYDNIHNAYAFEFSGGVFIGVGIDNPFKFEGYLIGWDADQTYPKSRLVNWLYENA